MTLPCCLRPFRPPRLPTATGKRTFQRIIILIALGRGVVKPRGLEMFGEVGKGLAIHRNLPRSAISTTSGRGNGEWGTGNREGGKATKSLRWEGVIRGLLSPFPLPHSPIGSCVPVSKDRDDDTACAGERRRGPCAAPAGRGSRRPHVIAYGGSLTLLWVVQERNPDHAADRGL